MFWFAIYSIVLSSLSVGDIEHTIKVNLQDGQLIANHEVRSGETLYGISKYYGSQVSDVLSLNPGLDITQLRVGQIITLPIDRGILTTRTCEKGAMKPVQYQLGKGETLFHLAHRVARADLTALMNINELTNHSLKEGQIITIGFIGCEETDIQIEESSFEELSPFVEDIPEFMDIETPSDSSFMQEEWLDVEMVKETRIISKRGIATWSNYDYEKGQMYAMHRTAKTSSEILVFNPMLKRQVRAVVIGQIPENTYPENISVVLSPSAVNALGGLDRQFLVEMTYIE